MNKWTQGPWRAEMVGDTNYARIFLHNRRDDGDSLRGYCGKANAHLIAAAPELYEACEILEEWLRREDTGFPNAFEVRSTPEGEQKWREWYDENLRLCGLAQTKARAALAKARGEA